MYKPCTCITIDSTNQATDCWRALEWNAMFEGPAGFLDMNYQTSLFTIALRQLISHNSEGHMQASYLFVAKQGLAVTLYRGLHKACPIYKTSSNPGKCQVFTFHNVVAH